MLEDCDHWSWVDVVDIMLSTLSICIGIYVTIRGVNGMWRNKNIKIFFKLSYFAVIASYFIASIASFIAKQSLNDIVFASYYITFILLIDILFYRLIFVFNDTSHSLQQYITIIFYIISVLSAITAIIDIFFHVSLQIYYVLIHLIASCTIFFMLVRKLTLLALESIQTVHNYVKIQHAKQYITLLLIILTCAFFLIVTDVTLYLIDECILYRIYIVHFVKLGLIVNIWCFYLQFSFSQTEYKKCCLYLDNIINRRIANDSTLNNGKHLTINVSRTSAVKHSINLSPNSTPGHMTAPTPTLLSSALSTSNEIMHVSLERISFSGKVIGKRGADKPRRYKKESKKLGSNIPAVIDAKSLSQNRIKALAKSVYSAPSPTVMSTHISSHHISQQSQELQISQACAVTTIVFEFADVLCTQIDKLQYKTATGSLNETPKELFFGGIERLDMLREWFADMHKCENLLCFIATNEASRMVTALLQQVELLIYFVSLHPTDDDKWVSNVIGYDHVIAKKVSSERHLILLKLIQSLGINHNHLLYIGSNKEVVDHIDNIYLCETYQVQTKGLVKRDLDEIKRKYFTVQGTD